MPQNDKDLTDLLNLFTGRYYEFKEFIKEKCTTQDERLNWEERFDKIIDLSRVIEIFSSENQAKTLKRNIEEKKKESKDDPFL